jgi:hypothetical protein
MVMTWIPTRRRPRPSPPASLSDLWSSITGWSPFHAPLLYRTPRARESILKPAHGLKARLPDADATMEDISVTALKTVRSMSSLKKEAQFFTSSTPERTRHRRT